MTLKRHALLWWQPVSAVLAANRSTVLIGLIAALIGCNQPTPITPPATPPGPPPPTTPTPPPTPPSGPGTQREEFNGPFATWADVKRDFGAKADGKTDDTAALQRGLDALGNTGQARFLYLPGGTYLIKKTLKLTAKTNVNLIGEDPRTTILRWGGGASGPMLEFSGVNYSRHGRFTLDGAGQATLGLYDYWDGQTGGYVTHNEYADIGFRDMNACLSIGKPHSGAAEIAIIRTSFLRCRDSGFWVGSFNSLDLWIWDSLFEDNGLAVTNRGGAGHVHAYNSVFRRSTSADIALQNASYFSFRGNYSEGSRAFLISDFVGGNSSQITVQGNSILDTLETPIQMSNPGPLMLIDNRIRSASSPAVRMETALPADLLSVGNTFTVAQPIASNGRLRALDDKIVAAASLNPVAPTLPATPPRVVRPIFEVSASAEDTEIQAAINEAVKVNGQRPVVHVAAGEHRINAPLVIPGGADLQLIGDGFAQGTVLSWFGPAGETVLRLAGPSLATLRDLELRGNYNQRANPLVIDGSDQAGARVYIEQGQGFGNANGNLLVDGVRRANVELHNFYHEDNPSTTLASVRVVGPNDAGGRTVIYGGASSNSPLNYDVQSGGSLLVQDMWYEGSPSSFTRLSGQGSFTMHGGRAALQGSPVIELNGFQGRATFLGMDLDGPVSVNGTAASKVLVADSYFSKGAQALVNSGGQAALLGSKYRTSGGALDLIPNQGQADDAFLREMLAQTRLELPEHTASVPAGATNVQVFRVMAVQGLTGITVRP